MKKRLYRILLIVLTLPLLFLLFLLYSTLTEYKPAPEIGNSTTEKADELPDSVIFSAMIWNIGYSGLGANMDFFYDGGDLVRDSRENVERNLQSITNLIKQNDSLDFILLQEVDLRSKRSYKINQLSLFDSLLGNHTAFLGINYKVGFVPVPPTAPLGKVNSGIITFSEYTPVSSVRYSFKGNYTWPTRTFMLKRCFLVNRYNLSNGKEFVLINTHNSAYDDGSLRATQLKQLSAFAQQEYKKGNLILIGGDWNQSPTGFKANYQNIFDTLNVSYLPEDFLPAWQQIYIDSVPTNRRIVTPYNAESTPTTVIDFYIASPNIEVRSKKLIDLDFENSDHNPVIITFSLN